MSYRQKLLGLGLEDDSAVVPEESLADTGAQELLEVNEVSAEIEDTHAAVAEATDSVDQLEEVAAGLESMITAGRGLSADAAMFANFAVSGATRKFGIATPMPSMESFIAGASGQMAQTKASLESITQTIKDIWKWIKAQFAKLRSHVKDFWLKTFDGAVRLKKRAQAMSKKAEGITKSVTGDATKVTVPADLVGKLHINNVLDVPAAIAALKTTVDAILTKQTDASIATAEAVITTITAMKMDNDGDFNTAVTAFIDASMKHVALPVYSKTLTDETPYAWAKEKGLTVKGTEELPGGKQAIVAFAMHKGSTNQSTLLASIAAQKGEIAQFREKEPDPKEKSETTLAAGKISSICDDVAGIATTIEGFRRNFQNQEKAKDAYTNAGKHMESEAPKAEKLSSDNQKLASKLASAILALPNMIDQPAQKMTGYAVSTLNAALNYAQLSLSKY